MSTPQAERQEDRGLGRRLVALLGLIVLMLGLAGVWVLWTNSTPAIQEVRESVFFLGVMIVGGVIIVLAVMRPSQP